jgi:hypothetical protein
MGRAEAAGVLPVRRTTLSAQCPDEAKMHRHVPVSQDLPWDARGLGQPGVLESGLVSAAVHRQAAEQFAPVLVVRLQCAGVSHASDTRSIERGRRRLGQVRVQRGAGDTRAFCGHRPVRTGRTLPVPCTRGSRDGSPALSSVAWASLCTRPNTVTGGGAFRCQ